MAIKFPFFGRRSDVTQPATSANGVNPALTDRTGASQRPPVPTGMPSYPRRAESPTRPAAALQDEAVPAPNNDVLQAIVGLTDRASRKHRTMATPGITKVVVKDPHHLGETVAKFPGVRTLILEGKDQWDGACLAPLQLCPGLRDLSIAGSSCLRDADLAHLSGLTELRRLSLTHCIDLRGGAMTHLAGLKKLQRLDLSGCAQIDDAGMAALATLPKLTAVTLKGCVNITAKGLAALARLPNLHTLDLGFCPMIHDLTAVQDMHNLQSLDLTGNFRLQDHAFIAFARNSPPALQRLDLTGPVALSDDAFSALQNLQQLHTLSVKGCRIGDAGSEALLKLPNLKNLDARDCDGLTAAAARALRVQPGLIRLQLD